MRTEAEVMVAVADSVAGWLRHQARLLRNGEISVSAGALDDKASQLEVVSAKLAVSIEVAR